jgi:perosamine synthetase
VHSPIPTRALLEALANVARPGRDSSPALQAYLRQAYDAEHVALCGSGTQALQLALQMARRHTSDAAVALPAFTCFDVATAAVALEARIALYDVDPETLAPDMDSVRRVLRGGARTLVVASLFGLSPDWDELSSCAAANDAVLVEDAAQGHGGRWRNQVLGSLAPLSVLSFARGKGWTGGRGGALLVRDGFGSPAVSAPVRAPAELEILVFAAAQRCLSSPALYAIPAAVPWLGLGETHYREPAAPTRLTRGGAALLTLSRPAAEEEATVRRNTAEWWQQSISPRPGVRMVQAHPDSDAGYLRFPLRVAGGLAGLPDPHEAVRLGVAPVYPAPLSALPEVRRRLANDGNAWPGAEELATSLVTLPTHSRLTAGERARILDLVNAAPG